MADCTICGNALTDTPRLGEWVAHDQCRESVVALINESVQRAMSSIIAEIDWEIEYQRGRQDDALVMANSAIHAVSRIKRIALWAKENAS